MKIYIVEKTGKIRKILTEFGNLSKKINDIFSCNTFYNNWVFFSNDEIFFSTNLKKTILKSENMILSENYIGILRKN